jgi:hypothetical protein
MVLNQLFIINPSKKLIIKILGFYGLSGLNDKNEFTFIDMEHNKTLDKFNKNKEEISGYYLPCKKESTFKNLTNKKCITITRQFLKTIDYDIISKEKWIHSKKYLQYKLVSKKDKEKEQKEKEERKKKEKEIVVTFD